jgi:SAM-dependent methyltransferase
MNRYSREDIVGRYVEAEWGDLVLRHLELPGEEDRLYAFGERNVPFYGQICRFVSKHIASPNRILDVGAGSGRLLRELALTFPAAEEIVGCEPSAELHSFAAAIFRKGPQIGWLPIVGSPTGRCDYVRATTSFYEAATQGFDPARVEIEGCEVENLPRPRSYFDLVCCLNVVDRHPHPRRLITEMAGHLRPGGRLCLASPMDWLEDSLARESRTHNLWGLTNAEDWETGVEESNLEYIFRTNHRRIVSYWTHVLLLHKRIHSTYLESE